MVYTVELPECLGTFSKLRNIPLLSLTCALMPSHCLCEATYSILCFLFQCSDCLLTCQNGGTLNAVACTCDCADGYSGATCASKCAAWSVKTDALFCIGHLPRVSSVSLNNTHSTKGGRIATRLASSGMVDLHIRIYPPTCSI